jgi:hypothetical protein
VIVIQNNDEGNLKPAEHIFEISHRKGGNALRKFRGEQRQELSFPWRRESHGYSHIMKKGTCVRVSIIHLIPEVRYFPVIEVARNKARLSTPCRSRDPGHRKMTAFIEAPKESLSHENPCHFRTHDFG